MENRRLLALTFGLTSELAVLIAAAYYLANALAENWGIDHNLSMASSIGGAFILWLVHVSFIFSKFSEDNDPVPGPPGRESSGGGGNDA